MNKQVEGLKDRFQQFLQTLESIEPETADLQEIDRLLNLIDELEVQVEKIRSNN